MPLLLLLFWYFAFCYFHHWIELWMNGRNQCLHIALKTGLTSSLSLDESLCLRRACPPVMWCLGLALLARRAAVCLRLRLEGTSSSSSSIIRANNSENLSKYKIYNYFIQVQWSLSCSWLRITHKNRTKHQVSQGLETKNKKKIYKMRSIMSSQKAAHSSGQLVKVARRYLWPFLICSLCLFTRYFWRLEVLAYSLNHAFVSLAAIATSKTKWTLLQRSECTPYICIWAH